MPIVYYIIALNLKIKLSNNYNLLFAKINLILSFFLTINTKEITLIPNFIDAYGPNFLWTNLINRVNIIIVTIIGIHIVIMVS